MRLVGETQHVIPNAAWLLSSQVCSKNVCFVVVIELHVKVNFCESDIAASSLNVLM